MSDITVTINGHVVELRRHYCYNAPVIYKYHIVDRGYMNAKVWVLGETLIKRLEALCRLPVIPTKTPNDRPTR